MKKIIYLVMLGLSSCRDDVGSLLGEPYSGPVALSQDCRYREFVVSGNVEKGTCKATPKSFSDFLDNISVDKNAVIFSFRKYPEGDAPVISTLYFSRRAPGNIFQEQAQCKQAEVSSNRVQWTCTLVKDEDGKIPDELFYLSRMELTRTCGARVLFTTQYCVNWGENLPVYVGNTLVPPIRPIDPTAVMDLFDLGELE